MVAVAGEPFPVGTEIEQGTVSKHDERRGFGEACEVSVEPGELVGADFRLRRETLSSATKCTPRWSNE
jgi:hypothetical protein